MEDENQEQQPAIEVPPAEAPPPVVETEDHVAERAEAAVSEEVPAAAGDGPGTEDGADTGEGTEEEENTGAAGEDPGTTENSQVALVPEVITTKKKSDELKIVIMATGNHSIIGISSPECDPFFKTIDEPLATVLQAVPELVEQAKVQWAISPTYPKAVLPKPPPPPPRATSTATSSKTSHTPKKSAATAPAKAAAQPNFF